MVIGAVLNLYTEVVFEHTDMYYVNKSYRKHLVKLSLTVKKLCNN